MKRLYVAIAAAVVALSAGGGAVSAQGGASWSQDTRLAPHIEYHYNHEGPGRQQVAVSGRNCDGSTYHTPLILGAYTERYEITC